MMALNRGICKHEARVVYMETRTCRHECKLTGEVCAKRNCGRFERDFAIGSSEAMKRIGASIGGGSHGKSRNGEGEGAAAP